MYIADRENNRIRFVSAITGILYTIAGDGSYGYNGDGIAATSASLAKPFRVAVDSLGSTLTSSFTRPYGCCVTASWHNHTNFITAYIGNVYIADKENHRIRMVSASTGNISTIAGDGNDGYYNGDGIAATSASLSNPHGLAVDSSGRRTH